MTRNDSSTAPVAPVATFAPWRTLKGATVKMPNTALANRDRLAAEQQAEHEAEAPTPPSWVADQAAHDLFAALYLQWKNPALRMLRSYFSFDTETAEELVEDAFGSIWVNLADLRPGSAQAWVFRIVVNKGRDCLRRTRTRAHYMGEVDSLDALAIGAVSTWDTGNMNPYDVVDVPEAYADSDPLARALGAEALAELLDRARTPRRRRIVVLDAMGWTNAEIAAAEGCSVGTVKRQLEVYRHTDLPRASEQTSEAEGAA